MIDDFPNLPTPRDSLLLVESDNSLADLTVALLRTNDYSVHRITGAHLASPYIEEQVSQSLGEGVGSPLGWR